MLLSRDEELRWRQAVQPRAVLRAEADDWQEAAAWLATHLATSAARRACASWAGARIGVPVEDVLALSPNLRTEFSRRMGRRTVDTRREPNDAAANLCREVLGWAEANETPLFARFGAWAVIAPAASLPTFLLEAGKDLPALLAAGDRLALDGYEVGLRVDRARWREALAGARWDRTTTRWREAEPVGDAPSHEPERNDPLPGEAAQRFVAAYAPGAGPLLARAGALIAREKSAGSNALSGEARSAAEALLFAVLEARPFTARRFALNVGLPFVFGLRKAEADLAATDARLVVEIDGYYHFRDADGYRRDRSKDALLQEHGWFVRRFLAEDVVRNPEDVVSEIERLLARRDVRVSPSETPLS